MGCGSKESDSPVSEHRGQAQPIALLVLRGDTDVRTPNWHGGPMLILTRKIGEVLHIGDEITLTVLNVKDSQVRLGIKAPKDVPVYRA